MAAQQKKKKAKKEEEKKCGISSRIQFIFLFVLWFLVNMSDWQ